MALLARFRRDSPGCRETAAKIVFSLSKRKTTAVLDAIDATTAPFFEGIKAISSRLRALFNGAAPQTYEEMSQLLLAVVGTCDNMAGQTTTSLEQEDDELLFQQPIGDIPIELLWARISSESMLPALPF